MILETNRLVLRPYTWQDLDALTEILSDPETMQHYPAPYDAQGVRSWIQRNLDRYAADGFGLWAVTLKKSGRLIGDCGLTLQNIDGELLPEVGYHIHKSLWHRGFGTEAARAVRDWAFRNTAYPALYSWMKHTNSGSQATARANGMQKLKEYPDAVNGISCVWRITRQEWERLSAEPEPLTRLIFVRHAQPVFSHADDRTRPLTALGMADSMTAARLLQGMQVDGFRSSPYLRSVDTIRPAAEARGLPIRTDERLRERQSGPGQNNHEMFRLRWQDHSFHEPDGESIGMVQHRNVEAVRELLDTCRGKSIVIGTHGTALSSILNYYDPDFGIDDYLRILDWMPYVIELDFDGHTLIGTQELGYVDRPFGG